MRNVTETVKQLIIINILFFVGTLVLGDVTYKFLALYFPENPSFQYWQPLTHMFMHGGLMHIFFNMFALYSFGSALEQMWGSKKFLFFYISCGLGAALLHTGVNYYYFQESLNTLIANGFQKTQILQLLNEGNIDTRWQQILSVSDLQNFTSAYLGTAVGASGAIYGVIVAFAFMFPNVYSRSHKSKVFCARFSFSRSVFRNFWEIYFWRWRNSPFCTRWWRVIWIYHHVVLEAKSVQPKSLELIQILQIPDEQFRNNKLKIEFYIFTKHNP